MTAPCLTRDELERFYNGPIPPERLAVAGMTMAEIAAARVKSHRSLVGFWRGEIRKFINNARQWDRLHCEPEAASCRKTVAGYFRAYRQAQDTLRRLEEECRA